MEIHDIRVRRSADPLPKTEQLAWKLAEVATDATAYETETLDDAAVDMVANRIIDNAAVAMAAVGRDPVIAARAQAMAHPRTSGATVWGLDCAQLFDAEWAAWANGVAVRELDMHDTYLAADYAHPADNIPPILAVAQQCRRSGRDLVRGILAAYEIHIALVRGICLHRHKKDHIAHLCPAQAAGIGALLQLDTDTVYQAIQQAVHVSFTTRQSRKGQISSWKAYAPAHAGKLAIEAVDRAMRGQTSPSPIYEGEDSVLAYMLDGPQSHYQVALPSRGEPRRAILESYTKEHSAEYQSQALIDLAFRMRNRIGDCNTIRRIEIRTSHHTHYVIGSGAGDPEKYDPQATRETLDHSIMYIFAVALQDGQWHHVHSYSRERATRDDTVRLWRKISTVEDPVWTQRYHHADPSQKAFGGRVVVELETGEVLEDELAVANAHPNGSHPFLRSDYQRKLASLTQDVVSDAERQRFNTLCDSLSDLPPDAIQGLSLVALPHVVKPAPQCARGIF